MAKEHAFPAGLSGGGNRHVFVVLGNARDDSSFLGTLSDARRHARNVSTIAGLGWSRHCGNVFPTDGGEVFRNRLAATREPNKIPILAHHANAKRRPCWNRFRFFASVDGDHSRCSSRLWPNLSIY